MQRDVCCYGPAGWRAPIEPAHSGGLCLRSGDVGRGHMMSGQCWRQSMYFKQEVPPPPLPPRIYDTFTSLKLQDSEEEEEIMRIYRSSCSTEGCTSQEKGAGQSRPGDLLRGTNSPLASRPRPSTHLCGLCRIATSSQVLRSTSTILLSVPSVCLCHHGEQRFQLL